MYLHVYIRTYMSHSYIRTYMSHSYIRTYMSHSYIRTYVSTFVPTCRIRTFVPTCLQSYLHVAFVPTCLLSYLHVLGTCRLTKFSFCFALCANPSCRGLCHSRKPRYKDRRLFVYWCFKREQHLHSDYDY